MTHRPLSIAIVVVTLAYVFVTPPFEVPDEPSHFLKAAQVATLAYPSTVEAAQPGAMLPADLVALAGSAFQRPAVGVARSYHLDDLVSAWRIPSTTTTVFGSFTTLGAYPPILYLPQAAGLALARAINLPALAQFYAARLFNAAAGLAMIFAGLAALPFGRQSVGWIVTMPMICALLGSVSADAPIIGLSFLTIGLVLRGATPTQSVGRGVLALVIPSLALAKGVYLPLALAGLSEARSWQKRQLGFLVLCLLVGTVLFAAWFSTMSGPVNRQRFVGRHTDEHLIAALPSEQIAYITAHPGAFTMAIVNEVAERLPVYAAGMIGRFGWFSVVLPLPLYGLAAIVIFAALCLPQAGSAPPRPLQRLVWIMAAMLSALMIETIFYISGTNLAANYVNGVQGRYFIPLLPLLVLALRLQPDIRLQHLAERSLPWTAGTLMAGGLATVVTAYWRL